MRLLLLSALLAVAAGASAQDILSIEPEDPTRGELVTVTFSAPVDSVTVTYRPGAVTAITEVMTPGSATFSFTPEKAGVVSVTAGAASQSLSVRYVGVPLGGLIVMILAGLILFGGAAISMRALLSDGDRIEIDPTLFPDT
ncbi:hypothetical protein [Rubrivirga sp. IMCC43871]|uniref:hypothetical protein n=1 Tax=Rubrivirga sp. IMCC43871 TaxID=3391575 RepID=UPI00398F986C